MIKAILEDEVVNGPKFKVPHLYQHTVTNEIILVLSQTGMRGQGLVLDNNKQLHADPVRFGSFLIELLIPYNKKVTIQNIDNSLIQKLN